MNVSDWRRSRLLLVSGAAVVTVAVGLLATLYVVRDGDGDAVTTSGDPAPLVTGELDEVLEPEDVLVESFGDGWVKQDEWYVESSADSATRTCPAFDELLSIAATAGRFPPVGTNGNWWTRSRSTGEIAARSKGT